MGIPEKRAETLFGERCYKKSHLKESRWLSSSKGSVGKMLIKGLLKQSNTCIYTHLKKLFPRERINFAFSVLIFRIGWLKIFFRAGAVFTI